MTSTLLIKPLTEPRLVAEKDSQQQSRIMIGKDVVGTITLRNAIDLTASVLDDVCEEEMDVIYPAFRQLQAKNAYYLDEIIIHEEQRGRGIGQDVMADLFRQNRPILLYSLADAEEFWEKMNFENICGYYYVWNPPKEA